METIRGELDKINVIYNQYRNRISEIERFIRFADGQKDFLNNFTDFLEKKEAIELPSEVNDYINNMADLNNSVVLYNAAIISIYGSFELFLDDLFQGYIIYLKTYKHKYSELDDNIKQKHLHKSAEYLTNSQRFQNLGLSSELVIKNLHKSINDDSIGNLSEQLLLYHGGNMKTSQLSELFNDFGFKDIISQLKKHRELIKFSRENDMEGDVIRNPKFPLLDKIVDERNKVAHGWTVEQRLSFQVLLNNYIPFMKILCKCIADSIISRIIRNYADSGILEEFEPIIHCWKGNTVIGINSGDFVLKVGNPFFYSDASGWFYVTSILNLQNDKKDRLEIRTRNKKITIETAVPINGSDSVWGIKRA